MFFTSSSLTVIVFCLLRMRLSKGELVEVEFLSWSKEGEMPADYDKGAYPEPPRQTPVVDKQTALPNPALILSKLFYYSVDLPVTTFRGNRS